MPGTVRLNCPLYHVPTSLSCLPYFRKTESSTIHRHCQRLWVAGLFSWVWRQMARRISRPKRRSRLSHERVGRAPSTSSSLNFWVEPLGIRSFPAKLQNQQPQFLALKRH